MNPTSEGSDSAANSSKLNRAPWFPIEQCEADKDPSKPSAPDSSKSRARLWTVLALGLIALGAVWKYSVFDPAQAARKGHYFVVAAYVQLDPEIVNRPIDGGWTLLDAATYGNHPEIVKLLIDSGADPNLPRDDPPLPISIAVENGHAGIVKLLVNAGADITVPSLYSENPLIMVAADGGHLEIVKILLDAGADPNSREVRTYPHMPDSEFVDTTLEVAAKRGSAEIVELLLERGAVVAYMVREDLTTELHTFCGDVPEVSDEEYENWLRSMPKIVDMLVQKLGDVDFRSCGFGQTALHITMASDNPGNLAIARHLVEHYPELNVNAGDWFWETPLHKAVSACNVRGIKYLLENCPELDINVTERMSGYTPLRSAEKSLAFAKGHNEESPYIKTRREGLPKIIELLKAYGGRINREAERRANRGGRAKSS